MREWVRTTVSGERETISAREPSSEMAIDFGPVLDAVNADELFRRINPVEDAVIAHAQFAKTHGSFI
jgi:hypothetical protein